MSDSTSFDPMSMPAAWVDHDLPYLPMPNRVEVVLTDRLAPAALTRTAFVLPFEADGSLVMATNRRRGTEFPGGHIEPGLDADAAAAAVREGREEVGCELSGLRPIGFLRMVSEGEVPEGWPYPHPVGYQQFFAAGVESRADYAENDECLRPTVVSPAEALDPSGPLGGARRVLWEEAFSLVFGFSPGAPAPG